MPTFFGPVTSTRSPVSTEPGNDAGNLLMRHFGSFTEGVNVFILTDNTVTTTQPASWDSVRRVLYGAHTEPITAAEASLLTASGYGAYIT